LKRQRLVVETKQQLRLAMLREVLLGANGHNLAGLTVRGKKSIDMGNGEARRAAEPTSGISFTSLLRL
jgi:hypothetical protein